MDDGSNESQAIRVGARIINDIVVKIDLKNNEKTVVLIQINH